MVKVEVIWSNGDTSTYEVKEDDLHKFSDKTITVIHISSPTRPSQSFLFTETTAIWDL